MRTAATPSARIPVRGGRSPSLKGAGPLAGTVDAAGLPDAGPPGGASASTSASGRDGATPVTSDVGVGPDRVTPSFTREGADCG
jgi:hypothetical protein